MMSQHSTYLTSLFLVLILTVSNSKTVAEENVIATADVIVYGATPGGFCAAIAAAREGSTVILLEPTTHIGGVNTGGLSFSDSNQTIRSTVMGLFHEWHSLIEKDYLTRGINLPYKVNVKDHAKWTYEPHVAMRVTKQMLDNAKVEVLTEHILEKVIKKGTQITHLVTNLGAISGRVFIDATYEGDLIDKAGVSWTIGREGRKDFGESLAGKQYTKRKMPVSGFNKSGETLPLITTTDAGADEQGDSNVMVYSFRLCLTSNPDNRVSFPIPDNYDPARFEIVRRYLKTKGARVGFDLYPLPNNKVDGNNSIGGQFSLGMVGACNGWSEADAVKRKAIWEAHKQYTLEFYHFLTTDPAVPAATRKQFSELGLCKDEFIKSHHWPPQLYVREGRRMQGIYVVSQKDILENPKKHDPIAVSSFPIDSHDCQRIAHKDGYVINEGTIFPVRMKGKRHGYPYHIPYRAILPKKEECNNLLVPVALSCTHIGISSIRVEPIWMIIGQSAGIAASLATKLDLSVQDLPYQKLKVRLSAQKQILELPNISTNRPIRVSADPKNFQGIVLDDSNALLKGTWKRSTNFKSYVDKGYVHDDRIGDGNSIAIYQFKAPKTGEYEIRMAYSAHATRATKVPVVISSGKHQTKLTVNQTIGIPAGKYFRKVGTVQLVADLETKIRVDNSGTNGFVILDAIQLVPLDK